MKDMKTGGGGVKQIIHVFIVYLYEGTLAQELDSLTKLEKEERERGKGREGGEGGEGGKD